ncbi:hypothetical protein ACFVTP_20340 [Streptomyces celluloflavus]
MTALADRPHTLSTGHFEEAGRIQDPPPAAPVDLTLETGALKDWVG